MVDHINNASNSNDDRAAYNRLFEAFYASKLSYTECEEYIDEDESEISLEWVDTRTLWLPEVVAEHTGFGSRAQCKIIAGTGNDSESFADFTFYPSRVNRANGYRYYVKYGLDGVPTLTVLHGRYGKRGDGTWGMIDQSRRLEQPQVFVRAMADALEQPQSFWELAKYALWPKKR